MNRRMGRRALVLSLAVVVAGTPYGGWRLWRTWSYRTALTEIRRQVQAGRHAVAARDLAALVAREPESDEAAYLLGFCAKALGRTKEAFEAWKRVRPGTAAAGPAALGLATLLVDQGKLGDAEIFINTALADPRVDGLDLRRFLGSLYWYEGRRDEALRLVEANWDQLNRAGRGGSDQAIELARLHIALVVGTSSTESVRGFLDRSTRLAPDDDRLWLAKANLAIREGDLDGAARWLDACRKRRPDDDAVWRARLDWAMAAARIDDAREAASHLPADESTSVLVRRLAAWFAACRQDREGERRALDKLLVVDPEDGPARDRLAELAIKGAEPDRAAGIRRRKSEIDQLKSQYKQLFLRDQPVRDAAEMARLAERLGRRFEARVFLTVAVSGAPTRTDLRDALGRMTAKSLDQEDGGPARSLADVLAAERADFATAGGEPATDVRPPAGSSSIAIEYQDDAGRARLDHVFVNGESPAHQIPEVSSGGVGLIDCDGDGWLDVYAVQGGPFPPPARGGRAGPATPGPGQQVNATRGDRLFRNRRDGTFEDVTERSGLPGVSQGYGHGVAVGDYDNDGHADLFITRWRSYALYRNRGDGTFEDVTAGVGLGGDRDWPTSAAFADLDNDGDLDLYVCHYLKWDAGKPPVCQNRSRSAATSCDPRAYEPMPDHVFRNDAGRFHDVTAGAGIADREGRGFGVVAVDVDDDNRVDLFVANDQSANNLFRNLGGFRFADQGLTSGVACNASGGNQAGMGVAAGDLDGDGAIDLAVTNFFNESTTLFHNLGSGQFADHTSVAGLAAPSRDRLGFGIAFLDANDDGRLDVVTANGHVNDYRHEIPYAMPIQLFAGTPGGGVRDVSARAGEPFLIAHIGRGLAVGDLDNDGRVDALMVAANEPLVYLHNKTPGGHSVTFALEGTTSNRDGVGARVIVEAGGSRQVAQRTGGGSFLSAGDPRLHFGLGRATRLDSVEVRWPSGRVDRFQNLQADQTYRLQEGNSGAVLLSTRRS